MHISNEWEVMLRDCDADEIHDATAPTLYLAYIVPHDDYQRARACVNKLADFPDLDECVVVSRAGLKAWGGLCKDMADAQTARITALEAELVKAKLKSMEYAEKLGELQGTSVLIASGEIDRLRSELALRDRLEAAGITLDFLPGVELPWAVRVRGVAYSFYETSDEARAAAELLEASRKETRRNTGQRRRRRDGN